MMLDKFKSYGLDINKSGEQRIKCPNCIEVLNRTNKSEKCLSVNLEKNLYHCHKCGDDYKGMIQVEEKKEYNTPAPVDNYELSEKALEFFNNRGISKSTLKRFKVSADSKCISFNFYRRDAHINTKKRYANKKFQLEPGCEIDFYNFDAINNEFLIITEGEIDALSVYESNPNLPVVSLPNGASSLKFLDDKIDLLSNIDEIVIATDGDDAGRKCRDNLLVRLGQDKCSFIEYPEDTKDFNDVLVKYGKEKVLELIDNRRMIPIKGIGTLEDYDARIDDYIINGFPEGLKTGDANIDDKVKLMLGQFVVVSGTPGSGKTTALDFLASLHINNIENNIRLGVLSAESHVSRHIMKIMCHYAKRDLTGEGYVSDEIQVYKKFVNENYVFVNSVDMDNLHYTAIIDKMKQMNKRYGCNYFIIDPYNYIERDGTDHTTHSTVLRAFANFSKMYNSLVVLVAHPRKMEKQDDGNYKAVTPYDILGSSDFYNIADTILSVWRDFHGDTTVVHVQKLRDDWLGECPSSFNLKYIGKTYETLHESEAPF